MENVLDLGVLATETAVLVGKAPEMYETVEDAVTAYQTMGERILTRDKGPSGTRRAIPFVAAAHVLLRLAQYAQDGHNAQETGRFASESIVDYFRALADRVNGKRDSYPSGMN